MIWAVRAVAAGALLTVAAGAGASGGDAASMLLRMSEAARKVNYQGVVVYQTQNRLETLRVIHGFDGDVEMERVQALDGAPREVVKRDGRVICLLPKQQRVTIDRPTPKGLFPMLSAERLAALAEIYEFEAIGEARVAGRPCTGLAIRPRDEFRYGYEIWADAQTDVPLQVNLVAPGGAILEQMKFTEVEFPQRIPASAFEADTAAQTAADGPAPAADVARVAAPARAPSPSGFRQLPPGFRVTMREVRVTADGKGTVEHVLVTDGLSAVSVFSARREVPAASFEGQSSMGAVHAFGRVVGRAHITVVGEAPPQTIRFIGENVQADEAGDSEAAAASGPVVGPVAPRAP